MTGLSRGTDSLPGWLLACSACVLPSASVAVASPAAEVSTGYISQVKLRCEKNYVFFNFDPNLQYQVASMELIGAPGTKFKLFQF